MFAAILALALAGQLQYTDTTTFPTDTTARNPYAYGQPYGGQYPTQYQYQYNYQPYPMYGYNYPYYSSVPYIRYGYPSHYGYGGHRRPR